MGCRRSGDAATILDVIVEFAPVLVLTRMANAVDTGRSCSRGSLTLALIGNGLRTILPGVLYAYAIEPSTSHHPGRLAEPPSNYRIAGFANNGECD